MGFCEIWQAQLFWSPGSISAASGMTPTGSGSCIWTLNAVCPVGSDPFSFLTLMVYFSCLLWLEVGGPVFVIFRLITDWTSVWAAAVLSNSSPSGIVLSGSTIAWFSSVVISLGAVTLMVMLRPPPIAVFSRMVAPMQFTTPDAWLQVNGAPPPLP